MSELEPKTPGGSHVRLSVVMNPEHANALGNVHGGVIMKLVDEAGALAAMRHARSIVVTVAIDSMTFMEPVYVGNLVTVDAEVTYVGRTSIETRVTVSAEDPLTGSVTMTNHAYVVYVAIDQQGHAHTVPPLVATTAEEQAAMDAGRERQAYRKQQRVKENLKQP
jgi:uncharacterized protein (TIGR00369 family)